MRLIQAGYEEPTSGLEPLSCSLRVIHRALQWVARVCKSRIFRPPSPSLPCPVLHRIAFPVVSEWYQQHPRIDLTTTTSSASSLPSGNLGTNPSRAPTTSTIRYGTERWRAS